MAFRTPSARALAPLLFVTATFATFVARPADADPKACIRAHASGQRELKAGHLKAASQLFTSCGSDESCPDQLRKECAEFLDTVKKTIPTVIFSALDEDGKDISGVKVYSNDDLVVDGLDGRAYEMDPGKYHLRFILPAGEPLSIDVVIREAEKTRVIQVKREKTAPAPDAVASGAPAPASKGLGPAPWIAAGVAVAALGTGITLGAIGSGKESDLNQCSPHCSDDMRSTYSSAKGLLLGADIGFGVALVSAGVATYLFISGAGEASPAPAPHESAYGAGAGAGTGAGGTHESAAAGAGAGAPATHVIAAALPGGGLLGLTGKF
jgi:hypothetical protein